MEIVCHAVDGWLLYIIPYGLLPASDICYVVSLVQAEGEPRFCNGCSDKRYGLEDPGFEYGQVEDSSLKKMSSLNLGRTTLSSPGVKWLGRDGNPLPPFCVSFS